MSAPHYHPWISQGFNDNIQQNNTVNILDTSTHMYIYMNMPGVKPETVDVEVYNNTIIVTGDCSCPLNHPEYTEISKEYNYGRIHRRIDIPICVSSRDNVVIDLKLGVLSIAINKILEQRNIFTMRIIATPSGEGQGQEEEEEEEEEEDEDEDEDEDEEEITDNGSVS